MFLFDYMDMFYVWFNKWFDLIWYFLPCLPKILDSDWLIGLGYYPISYGTPFTGLAWKHHVIISKLFYKYIHEGLNILSLLIQITHSITKSVKRNARVSMRYFGERNDIIYFIIKWSRHPLCVDFYDE